MTWVLIIAVAWLAVSVVVAVLIAGGIRVADQRRKRVPQSAAGTLEVRPQPVAEPRRAAPPAARKPVVRDCIPPSERATRTRQTGTR
jgi:hypothetical protein